MPVQTVTGDLFQAGEQVIGHQVNCQGVMGSGVAKQMKRVYPEVFAAYAQMCGEKEKQELLGLCQLVPLEDGGGRYAANLFGQLTYGRGGKKYTDDDALRKAFIRLSEFAKQHQLTVALPYKIGCDRGGGDWDTVLGMINDIFADMEVVLYRLE
jgi:O-acetyl-ADP-ribose deacetylase (regulator of RNase III)